MKAIDESRWRYRMKTTVLRERLEETADWFKLESGRWDEVPPTCLKLQVDASKVKRFDPVATLKKLKTLSVEHVRDEDCDQIAKLTGLRTLFLISPNISSLEPLRSMSRLEGLSIMHGAKVCSFRGIEGMQSLRFLHAYNIPRVNDLAPLGKLTELRELDLQMSWATTKKLSFKTLSPLGRLAQLRLLDLRGVDTDDDSLRPLGSLKKLKSLFPCHLGMPIEELAYLAAVLNRTLSKEDRLFATKPIDNPHKTWMCKKCGGPPVQLIGRIGKRYQWKACPVCETALIAEREASFAKARLRHGGTL